MNSWDSFNQYEQLQRRARAEREQQLAEQQHQKHLEVEKLQAIREQERREAEQRQSAQLQAALKPREQQAIKSVSPIEEAFHSAWREAYPSIELKRQFQIGKYRVDFAHVATQTAIELDGHDFHSRKRDRNRDYARHHAIEDQGWYIVRFTGSQIWNDLDSCIRLVHSRIITRFGKAWNG